MGITQKISGYFKQLVGEIYGSQAVYDEGCREVQGNSEPVSRADMEGGASDTGLARGRHGLNSETELGMASWAERSDKAPSINDRE